MSLARLTYHVFVGLSILIVTERQANSATWTPTAAGTSNWNTNANPPWDTAVFPNGVDQIASLTNDILGTQTINLASPITIGTLNIGDVDSSHIFTLQNGTGGSLTFDVSSGSAAINRTSGALDIISASLILADNLVITTSVANTLQTGGIISETGGAKSITKNGTGRISLAGANTFTGGVIINDGIVAGTGTASFGRNTITFGPGSTGRLAVNNNFSIGGLVTNTGSPGTAIVENGTATNRTLTVTNNVDNVYSGIFQNGSTGTLGLTKAGTGTLTLNGAAASTHTGITRVNGGKLTLDFANFAAGTNLLDPTSALNVAGAEFNLLGRSSGSTSQTFASFRVLGGDGKLTVNGNGGLSTTLAITSPTVVVGNGTVVDISTIGTGHFSLPASNINGILGAYATFGGNSWARNDGSANNFIEALPNASYLTTTAAGNSAANYLDDSNITVTSSPTLDAPVIVNSLRFNNAAASTVSLTGSNFIHSGGILVTSGVGNNLSKITGGTITGNTLFAISTGLMVVQNNTANELEIASDIVDNGAASTLNKSGPGTLKLSGTGNSYTGITFISGGTLKLGASDVIPDASRVDFPKSTGVLDLNGFSDTIDALSAEGGIVTNSAAGPSVLTTNSATNVTYAGSLQNGVGTVALMKSGSSILTLTGTSTHTGGTTVNAGTLRANSNSALGLGSLILAGGTFDSNAMVTIANNISVTDSTTTNVVSNAAAPLTLTGAITGTGTFQSNGTPNQITHIQGKINGFTGTFAYNALTNGNSLYFDGTDPDSQNGSNAKFIVDGVATRSLRFGSASGIFKMGELSGSGGTIRNEFAGPHTLEIGNLNTDSTYSGVITSPAAEPITLSKVGTGILTLNGANTYTGATKVQQGTLSIGNPYLADTADVYLSTGAILDLNFGGADTIDELFINAISQATGTWGAVGSGADHETGLITGSGLLLVSPAGLPGDYNGNLIVDAADYVVWRKNPGAFGGSPDGYNTWRANFGATSGSGSGVGSSAVVPEPAAAGLIFTIVLGALSRRWPRLNWLT